MHMIYALEEAIKTMAPGVTQWVWAMDMKGMGFKHMDPRLPQHMNALFSLHYPETLGMALIINAPGIFSTFFNMIKGYVDPNTVAKVRFAKGDAAKLHLKFDEVFPSDLADWLVDEVQLNQARRLAPSQQVWWLQPPVVSAPPDQVRLRMMMMHCPKENECVQVPLL